MFYMYIKTILLYFLQFENHEIKRVLDYFFCLFLSEITQWIYLKNAKVL